MNGLRPDINNHKGEGADKWVSKVKATPGFIRYLQRKGVKFKMIGDRLFYTDNLKLLTDKDKNNIGESKEIIKPMLFGCDHCIARIYQKGGHYKGKRTCGGIAWFWGRSGKTLPIEKCRCPLPKGSEASTSDSIGKYVHKVHKSTKSLF